MKYYIPGMIALILCASAQAQTSCHVTGNTSFCSNGVSYSKIGNTYFGSQGDSYTQIGNTYFGSGGDSYTKIGNTYFGSNGDSYTQIGNTLFGSNGAQISGMAETTKVVEEEPQPSGRAAALEGLLPNPLGTNNPVTVDQNGFFE